jgi:hypothetical protein
MNMPTNANWGLQDWGMGTTYEPQGGFFQRGLDGNPVGLTQGAFRGIGAGMQGAGQAMMQRGRSPAEMGLMGLAQGANMQNQQGQQERMLGAFRALQQGNMQPGGGDTAQSYVLDRMGPQGAEMRKHLARPPLFNENMAAQAEAAGTNHMFRGGFANPMQRR